MTNLLTPLVLTLVLALAGCSGTGSAQNAVRGADSTADTAAAATAATATAADTTDPFAGRSKGSRTAPVTVYEMSDFQCPFCRRFALETFPTIEREYVTSGKVRWIFVNFPLTSLHPNAVPAAEFSLCAARQGKFWPAHDLIFETQQQWAKLPEAGPFLLGLGDSLGLARDSVLACLQDPATRAAVQQEAQSASRAGANSTPTFYIEGGLLAGAYPIEVFRQVLDSIHREKSGVTD